MNRLFPIFVKLENLHSLIVGGGYVAHEKLTAILSNSPQAKLTIVAPEIRDSIRETALNNPHITLIERPFQIDDLEDKDLLFVATNIPELNKEIKAEAAARHLLANVADTPDQCDFYLSSVVQKGNLKLGISTNGLSPTMAKRLREVLTEALPDNLETALQQLYTIREYLRGDFEQKVEELNQLTRDLIRRKKVSSGKD